MKKRITAAILLAFFVLTSATFARMFVFAPENPFLKFDESREEAIGNAVLSPSGEEGDKSYCRSTKCIVKFRADTNPSLAQELLSPYEYYPLSDSSELLFAVECGEDEFDTSNAALEYVEPDLPRYTMAAANDPLVPEAYGDIGIFSAWDISPSADNVIVAVLDTGIERSHEDLEGVNILNGYDAVKRSAGVYSDSAGHGTAVAGVIAAVSGNKTGVAGIAPGVTILPIKVSVSGVTIYSSDLISGIRFAADAGADIINMSVGGYSASYAEQEAVDYAVSKGCILIAASGNEGNLSYAGQKSYPASYNGVISVASSSADGEASGFSQYNEKVTVAAPGENIPVIACENGKSVYRYDSGTSYSAAVVSGIAALAVAKAGNVRLGSAEFESLIREACGNVRNDKLGYGIINAEKLVSLSDKPVVTGVINGLTYSEKLVIGFNRGTAYVDGELISDGETVLVKGRHTLTVKDGDYEKTFVFRLNYEPLSCSVNEYTDHTCVEFNRGTAFLDGFAYKSGEYITSPGEHLFVLTDGDEVIEKSFTVYGSNIKIIGAENNAVYDSPVYITVSGAGKALLDGSEILGSVSVASNGVHKVELYGENGNLTETVTFTLKIPLSAYGMCDYQCPSVYYDEENGYTLMYGESLVGIRVYFSDLPEKYNVFLPVGTVYSHAVAGNMLVFAGENGITVLDRALVRTGNCIVFTDNDILPSFVFEHAGKIIVYAENGFISFDPLSGERAYVAVTDKIISSAASDGDFINAYCPTENAVVRFDITENTEITVPLKHKAEGNAKFFGNILVVGNKLFSVTEGSLLLEFCSDAAIAVKDGRLFTADCIINISDGEVNGVFPFSVSDIAFGAERNMIFGVYGEVAYASASASGMSAFCASTPSFNISSEPEKNDNYRDTVYIGGHKRLISVSSADEKVFMLFEYDQRLYSLSGDLYASSVPLAFVPSCVYASDDNACVAFADVSKIFVARADMSEGKYIDIPAVCTDACILSGRLYAVCGGKIVICDIAAGTVTETSVNAESIACFENNIYAVNKKTLSSYDKSLSLVKSVRIAEGVLSAEGAVACGKTLYNADLSVKHTFNKKILAVKGDVCVSGNEVYSLSAGIAYGNTGADAANFAAFTADNSLYVFGNGKVVRHSFGNGKELTYTPAISGAEEGKTYIGDVRISFSSGIGFLDGEAFLSGNRASGNGEHCFVIALPFGRRIAISFKIAVALEKIEFVVSERHMSVGETIIMHVLYLPDGANSVPLVYACESDGISVDEVGTVTAFKVGTYKVTAYSAENHTVRAECTVKVSDKLVAFLPESGFTVDRENGIVCGVKPGTEACFLLSALATGAEAKIISASGKEQNGIVSTGDSIVLYEEGNLLDELVISVSGDTDGDGLISAYDLYELERILKGYSYSHAFVAAADLNGDGIPTNSDYMFLRNVLLGRQQFDVGMPQDNPFGSFFVDFSSQRESSEIFDAAVCIMGCKHTKAVSGCIELGSIEYVSSYSTGWEYNCYVSDGRLYFTAFADDGNECGTAFKVLFGIKLRITGEPGDEFPAVCEGVTAKLGDKTVRVKSKESILTVTQPSIGSFSFDILTAHRFSYDKNKYEYNVTVPYNCALADIVFSREEGGSVYISDTVIPDSGRLVVHISHSDGNGSSGYYTINIKRDNEPVFDTDCRLSDLEAEGFRLTPDFDPDVYNYYVTVPYGTERISLYCVAQSKEAEILISDCTLNGEASVIEVTVVSPDGEMLVYTVNVTVLPPSCDSSSDASESEESEGTVLIIIAAVTLVIGALLMLLFRSRGGEDQTEEPDIQTESSDGLTENSCENSVAENGNMKDNAKDNN